MKKSDFKKGQEVFLLVIEGSNMHRHIRDDSHLARIRKCIVTSVGSKYITVSVGHYSAKFSIEENFVHVVEAGSRDYELFLTYDAVIDHLEYQNLQRIVRDFFSSQSEELTLEELRKISDIIKNRERQGNEDE